MKKRIALLLLICFALNLTACFNVDGFGDDKLYFSARVIAVEGNEMLVGGGNLGLCIVTFPEDADLGDYERGDYVEIGHSGAVADSYPSQAKGYAIRQLSREKIKEFHRDVTTTAVCEMMDQDILYVISDGKRYRMNTKDVRDLPKIVSGDTLEIVYDGIVDDGALAGGASEICFPSAIRVVAP